MPNPVEVLTAAREHLVKYGWRQYKLDDDATETRFGAPCCALQAIYFTHPRDPFYGSARVFLIKALPQDYGSVAIYNCAPGRTFDEILALYDRAIELAEREVTQ